jgi:hypothetical protein
MASITKHENISIIFHFSDIKRAVARGAIAKKSFGDEKISNSQPSGNLRILLF